MVRQKDFRYIGEINMIKDILETFGEIAYEVLDTIFEFEEE